MSQIADEEYLLNTTPLRRRRGEEEEADFGPGGFVSIPSIDLALMYEFSQLFQHTHKWDPGAGQSSHILTSFTRGVWNM